MTRTYVHLWRWFREFERRAQAAGDFERVRLVKLHDRVWEIRERDPEQALTLCREGAELARQLQEPCMELFHEYWAAEVLLFYLIRETEALNMATRLVTKASQPQYRQCPVYARVYITLIVTCASVDLLSYEPEIREMTAYMERELPLDSDTHWRLQGIRARLEVEHDDFHAAETEALKYLEMVAGDSFRQMDAYGLLTRIMYLQHQDEKALEYAALYAQKAQYVHSLADMAGSLHWQALLQRLRGNETTAQQLFTQGMTHAAAISMMGASNGGFNSLCRFYEAGQEYDKSLAHRDQQLEVMRERPGSALFDTHLKRCLVLKLMNQLTPADIEAARSAAQPLKSPEKHLARLESLVNARQVARY